MSQLDTVFTLQGLVSSRFAAYRVIPIPDPAAGSQVSLSVPGGRAWILHSVRVVLTTSAAVANRLMILRIMAGEHESIRFTASAVQTASTSMIYAFAPDIASVSTSVVTMVPIASTLVLLPGFRLETAVDSLQATDVLSGTVVTVTEFYYPT